MALLVLHEVATHITKQNFIMIFQHIMYEEKKITRMLKTLFFEIFVLTAV